MTAKIAAMDAGTYFCDNPNITYLVSGRISLVASRMWLLIRLKSDDYIILYQILGLS